mgnify:FL=1
MGKKKRLVEAWAGMGDSSGEMLLSADGDYTNKQQSTSFAHA